MKKGSTVFTVALLGSVVNADHYESCGYTRHQGLCVAPYGGVLGMWRNTSRQWCIQKCNEDPNCRTYLYAEGEAHIYTGTCELYDGRSNGGDGNRGWSCYAKD